MQLLKSYWWILVAMAFVIIMAIVLIPSDFRKIKPSPETENGIEWDIPDINRLSQSPEDDLIRYGKDLIVNTAVYLGPKGSVASISNGMNCENCHLDAGTRFLGNNYSAVYSNYPKFRARSGRIETIYKRVNDCFERSLNGVSLDSNSREMQAIYAYIRWLGKNVPKNKRTVGSGIPDLPLLERSADPETGKLIYAQKCQRCHTLNGEGVLTAEGNAYKYPPLWGEHSYNTSAGLFRLSRLAGYIRHNMPYTADNDHDADDIALTDEESWDLAAYINTQPRPQKKYANDWPDISSKPFDHPFGPYVDNFTEVQHKYGPFAAIKNAGKKK
ncbi:hypothetical protein BH11BAC4_BH11BAC4_24560 [soil metagenome]